MEAHSVYAVFTPNSRARVNFVPRATVNDHLVSALRTPGRQIVLYGESGSGKSTLLQRKLEELYENHITTRCFGTSTFDGIIRDAFDQLDRYYTSQMGASGKTGMSSVLSAEFLAIKATLNATREHTSSSVQSRVIPPELSPQRLGEFLGQSGLCWVLEDFHKVPASEKRPLAQSLKIFSDLAAEYPSLKVIALGATDTARDVVEYDAEMRHRVAEIHVPLMTKDELSEIILGGQILLNVDMAPLRAPFVQYSMGVAAVCHQLALNACLHEGVETTQTKQFRFTGEQLEPSLRRWVIESSDTLKSTFDRALLRHKIRRFDNTRLILRALAQGPLVGMLHGEILRSIREIEPSYPGSNLTAYLRQLMAEERGSLILQSPDNRYRFVDPLHHTYAQAVLLEAKAAPPSEFTFVMTTQLMNYWKTDWSQTVEITPARTMLVDRWGEPIKRV